MRPKRARPGNASFVCIAGGVGALSPPPTPPQATMWTMRHAAQLLWTPCVAKRSQPRLLCILRVIHGRLDDWQYRHTFPPLAELPRCQSCLLPLFDDRGCTVANTHARQYRAKGTVCPQTCGNTQACMHLVWYGSKDVRARTGNIGADTAELSERWEERPGCPVLFRHLGPHESV